MTDDYNFGEPMEFSPERKERKRLIPLPELIESEIMGIFC
jgi:hypothetical protein